jgi:hypothetical protein
MGSAALGYDEPSRGEESAVALEAGALGAGRGGGYGGRGEVEDKQFAYAPWIFAQKPLSRIDITNRDPIFYKYPVNWIAINNRDPIFYKYPLVLN